MAMRNFLLYCIIAACSQLCARAAAPATNQSWVERSNLKMVNLGRMTPAAAKDFLMREVTLSEPFAQQEADRYAFLAPGQAVSYLYGYTRLRELRIKAELALGTRFDPLKFHDLIMAQGLLPPDLLERAVLEELKRTE